MAPPIDTVGIGTSKFGEEFSVQCDVCCKRGLFPVPLKDGADDSDDTLSEEPSFEELDNDGYNN